jgi:hypothetical protein
MPAPITPEFDFLLELSALKPTLFSPSCELREEALGALLVIHERQ